MTLIFLIRPFSSLIRYTAQKILTQNMFSTVATLDGQVFLMYDVQVANLNSERRQKG